MHVIARPKYHPTSFCLSYSEMLPDSVIFVEPKATPTIFEYMERTDLMPITRLMATSENPIEAPISTSLNRKRSRQPISPKMSEIKMKLRSLIGGKAD